MKILLVSRALPIHVPGGLERHVEDLAIGLAARGVDVHLLCAPLAEDEKHRLLQLGVTTHEAPGGNPRRYGPRYLLGIGGRIHELYLRNKYDVIHAQEFGLGIWNPPLAAPPIILSVHGTITSETPLHPDVWRQLSFLQKPWALLRFGRRRLYGPFWKRHLRRAARILVDSEFTRRELDRIVPDSRGAISRVPLAIRDIGEPVDRDAARRELGWTGLRLLTVGRTEWQKGQTLALEALAGVRGVDWNYTIAGVGSDEGSIRNLIAKLRLEQRVTLIGRVDETTKLKMMAAADLFLWPERAHPAFGLVGLESLLQNTPVLATPMGAIPEVVGQRGGWLAKEPTADALRDALMPLLKDPALLAAKRDGLRDWAKWQFDFDAFIELMIHHYTAVSRVNRIMI